MFKFLLKKQYRIKEIGISFPYYKVDYRYVWWPWWFPCYGWNDSTTLERAETIVRRHRQGLPKDTIRIIDVDGNGRAV